MGRFFPYTLHPISVGECLNAKRDELLIRKPAPIGKHEREALWRYGGFPEPFLQANQEFYNRWKRLQMEQLFREDLRDLTRIQDLDQIEMLVGQLTSYSYIANTVRVSVDTIRRWIATLESLYFCFTFRPWYKNVARSLRKEPKY